MKKFNIFAFIFLCALSTFAEVKINTSAITVDDKIRYAQRKIIESFGQQQQIDLNIEFKINTALGDESYSLTSAKNSVTITGGDSKGVIYGSLELIRQFKISDDIAKITNTAESPTLQFRAIKFNLPYLAYRSDASTAQHDVVCHDLHFWEKYLDMMAENRFNVLSLWSLHLFHYMTKPKSFPESTQFSDVEMAAWHDFWTKLFKMAHERGIETYIINWNTFVSPSFAAAHNLAQYCQKPSHYGAGDTSKIAEQYTREIIKQVINEYPDLDGLGITLGERMGGQTPDERRAWLDRTIFAGMKDANRKIKFIYRAPLSADKGSGGSTSEDNDMATRKQIEGLDVNGPVWVEFKYNWSHGHSSPNLFIVHGGKLTDKYMNPEPTKHKYIWTVRNEDFFTLRWGQPDFIRQFLQNNTTQSYVGGCFIGSEVFIPALDYISKDGAHKNWEYAFERQWLLYSEWGNLLYNPKTPDSKFEQQLAARYGNANGKIAFDAWNLISKVPLHFASFHQGRNDLSLYTEGFCSYTEFGDVKMFDIEKFSTAQVLDTIRYVNIVDFVKGNQPKGSMSPLQLADMLDKDGTEAMKLVAQLRGQKLSPTIEVELNDIEAWYCFGRYFADKLRAGVALYQYRIKNENTQQQAVALLEKCLQHWTNYVATITRYNHNEFVFHTKDPFSWSKTIDQVKNDIELAKKPK